MNNVYKDLIKLYVVIVFQWYFHNIENCEYAVDIWYTFEEVAGIAGFEVPE